MSSGDIRHRLYISYGAWNAIFSFFIAREVLLFQAVSKFMYFRGVERFQKRVTVADYEVHFFHYPGMGRWQYSLFTYYTKTMQPMAAI